MNSTFCISGYGYNVDLCSVVVIWFFEKFLPRHKIELEVLHRGLKREKVLGYCDLTDENYKRPREFLIELQTHMDEESYIKTLLHELTHLRQWVVGSLRLRSGKMYYGKECMEDVDYWFQPHEIFARREEILLYQEYIKEKKSSQQYFQNRLCN